MKICLINNLYYPYQRGGAEKVVKTMAEEYKKSGHQVCIITTRAKEKKESELQGVYYLSSSYYHLNKYNKFFRLVWHIHNLFSSHLPKQIQNIIKTERPDLIITHNLMGLGFLSAKLISELNIPHHHFLHDIQLLHPSGLMYYQQENKINSIGAKLYQRITKRYFSSLSKVISPSQWLLNEHTKRGFFTGIKQEIKPFNNINIAFIVPSAKHNPNKLTFIGQLEKHKGINTLISAFINIDNKDLSLNIIGTGSQFNKIKTLSAKDPRIKLWGWKEEKELLSILSDSTCLIIPSLCYENSPTIIQYAHQLKIPVIASGIGGIPETINNNDLLIEPNNIKDLQNKIEQVIKKDY